MSCRGYTRRRVMFYNGKTQGYYSIYLPDIGAGQPDTRHLARIDFMGELAAMEKYAAVPFDTDYREERSYINKPRRVSIA
jgi:hypothetical protein